MVDSVKAKLGAGYFAALAALLVLHVHFLFSMWTLTAMLLALAVIRLWLGAVIQAIEKGKSNE